MRVFHVGPIKKWLNDISSFAHETYRYRTSSSNYVWEINKNLGTDSILKWEVVKKKRIHV